MNGESRAEKAEADPAPPNGGLYVFTTGVLLGLVPICSASLREEQWLCETAILLRLVLTILAASATVLFCGSSFGLQRKHIRKFLGYGVVSIALVNFFYLKSLELAPASVAVFSVFASAPVTTLVATWIRKKAQPARRELGLIGLIILGCLLVNYADGWSGSYWRGASLAALAGVFYGLYSIFGQDISKEYTGPSLLFWQFTFAGVATAGFYVLFPGYHQVFGQLAKLAIEPRLDIWIPALGLGLVATFLPYLLYGLGLRRGCKPATASALTLLEPVSTVILAWLILGQVLSLIQGIGCVVVLTASLALSRFKCSKQPLSTSTQL